MSEQNSNKGRPLDYSIVSGRGERLALTPSRLIAAHILASFGGKGARIERGGALLYWAQANEEPETIQAAVAKMEA